MTTTILIVDDEQPIRNLLKRFLTTNYTPVTAENVAEAREILDSQTIDLVITDINMPGESGIDLIKYIKRQHPDIGIIVATVLDNPVQARIILDAGVYGYIVKPFSENFVLITVANALRRAQLEKQSKQLTSQLEFRLQTILDNIPIGFLLVDENGRIVEVNNRVEEWFNESLRGAHIVVLNGFVIDDRQEESLSFLFEETLSKGQRRQVEVGMAAGTGDRAMIFTFIPVSSSPKSDGNVVVMIEDVTEKNLLEKELRQAQKLEAIGQLAAGIAHEINTPVQYVGDNIRFIADAYGDIDALLGGYEELIGFLKERNLADTLIETIEKLRETADLEYLREEIPATIQQSLEGVGRIASIVKAMKEFSHPGMAEKVNIDINAALQSTITVSRNEWKYVADIETDFDNSLPPVPCFAGELNQVILNMIVNSAHSIENKVEKKTYSRGVISLSTRKEDDNVVITLSDNGEGMSDDVRQRIFEPFFTTKEIGKGTGQGLTIARGIIEDKHGGSLQCESEEGEGATFIMTLPLSP